MSTVVFYDGECDFCLACVNWVKSRYEIEALPNNSPRISNYGLTREIVDKSVVVIDSKIMTSAKAVSFLLKKSGFKKSAFLLKASGPLGELGYKYVASHRDGLIVRIAHKMILKTTKK